MIRGRPPASHSSAKLADRARVDALRSLLAGFMPAILASGVVRAALKAQGQHDDACSAERFADVVSHCRVGLSLFVAPARLPELMLALADLLVQHEQGAA